MASRSARSSSSSEAIVRGRAALSIQIAHRCLTRRPFDPLLSQRLTGDAASTDASPALFCNSSRCRSIASPTFSKALSRGGMRHFPRASGRRRRRPRPLGQPHTVTIAFQWRSRSSLSFKSVRGPGHLCVAGRLLIHPHRGVGLIVEWGVRGRKRAGQRWQEWQEGVESGAVDACRRRNRKEQIKKGS